MIVGARTDEQLADNLAAATLELTDDEQAQLEQVSRPHADLPVLAPARQRSDRLSAADLSLLGSYPAP